MKKIALASAAMGGAALIAFGANGTFAAFTDVEQGTASASAGTMDLTIGGGKQTGDISTLGMNPGQTTTVSYWVSNTGTTAGTLTADLSVSDEERNCTEPEKGSGDKSCGWETGGEFSSFATVQFQKAAATTPETCAEAESGQRIAPAVSLKRAANAGATPVGSLGANAGNCFVVVVELPGTADNTVQGDVSNIKVDLTLTQETVQPV